MPWYDDPAMAEPHRRPTFEEYLAAERAGAEKHDFDRGAVYAMGGASRRHNRLVTNLILALGPELRRRGCEIYANDMRVRVEAADFAAYPGVVVVRGEPDFADPHQDTLLDPLLIVEVLSPSTADYDRGTKFAACRALPSLGEYLLVAQDRMHVEHFVRQGDGSWRLTEHGAGAAALELPSIGCRLSMRDLYDGFDALG